MAASLSGRSLDKVVPAEVPQLHKLLLSCGQGHSLHERAIPVVHVSVDVLVALVLPENVDDQVLVLARVEVVAGQDRPCLSALGHGQDQIVSEKLGQAFLECLDRKFEGNLVVSVTSLADFHLLAAVDEVIPGDRAKDGTSLEGTH